MRGTGTDWPSTSAISGKQHERHALSVFSTCDIFSGNHKVVVYGRLLEIYSLGYMIQVSELLLEPVTTVKTPASQIQSEHPRILRRSFSSETHTSNTAH
jgi:hypothetical protein